MKSSRTLWLIGACLVIAVIVLTIVFTMNDSNVVVIKNTHPGATATSTGATGGTTSTDAGDATSMNGNSDPVPTDGSAGSSASDGFVFPSSTALVPMTAAQDAVYDTDMLALANLPVVTKTLRASSTIINSTTGTSSVVFHNVTVTSTAVTGWPVKSAPYPYQGALLPYHRIVAYYGNLYSTQMGVLGEYPTSTVLAMLQSTTAMWATADPSVPTIPALDYIAVSAQSSPGPDGKYRLRMPDSQLDEIMAMAAQVHGIVFLDIQVGLSNVETEVPLLQKYLAMPNVELSLDPEFDMHDGAVPGTVIGTMDASDINWAANYLAQLVATDNLPPKILVIHRFTDDMVTNTSQIKPLPEVQIVMDMDGFGFPAKKINTYEQVIVPYPVQFTGFKLFYKNDAAGPLGALMTPAQVLKLSPQPSYIQYQ
jgi:hypothetical protein